MQVALTNGAYIPGESEEWQPIQIQGSPDGLTYWEYGFNPNPHNHSETGAYVDGHNYIRFRGGIGDDWTMPAKIVGKDAKEIDVEKRDDGLYLIVKDSGTVESEELLVLIEELKGSPGPRGATGAGLRIDAVLFYDEMLQTNPTVASSRPCNPCDDSKSTGTFPKLVMCAGDNKYHILNDSDDAGTYYQNANGDIVEYLPAHAGLAVQYYGASDAAGTGLTDCRTENTLSYGGWIFYWNGSIWSKSELSFGNMLLAPRESSAIYGQYMEDYLDGDSPFELDSAEDLIITDGAIVGTKLSSTIFDNGLSFSGGVAKVDTSELIDETSDYVGLSSYTDSAGNKQLQLDITDHHLSDGLEVETATYDANGQYTALELRVTPEDFAPGELGSAIDTVDGSDGYKNIIWKYDSKSLAVNGSNEAKVLPDDKSVYIVDASPYGVAVKPYAGDASFGIRKEHLNPDVADTAKGIKKGEGSTDPLEIIIDTETIRFKHISGTDYGIGVEPNSLGAEYLREPLAGQGLKFTNLDVSGRTTESSDLELDIDTTYFEFSGNQLSIKENAVVKSITRDGTSVQDNVTIDVDTSDTYIDTSIAADNATDTLEFAISLDYAQLKTDLESYFDGVYASAGSTPTVYWGGLAKTSGDAQTVEEAIDERVPYNTYVGNTMIHNGEGGTYVPGLYMKDGTDEFRIIIDGATGSIDSVPV